MRFTREIEKSFPLIALIVRRFSVRLYVIANWICRGQIGDCANGGGVAIRKPYSLLYLYSLHLSNS